MKKHNLLSIAYERDFNALEEAWMAALETLPDSSEELLKVIDWLIRVKEGERAEVFMTMLVEAFEEQRPGQTALTIIETALEKYPLNTELREAFVRQFVNVHAANPTAAGIIRISGITNGVEMNTVKAEIKKRMQLQSGNYAVHRKRRHPLRIESYNPVEDTLLVNDGSHEFATNLVTFLDQYDKLPLTDFRARLVFEPELLTELAHEDPVALISQYLLVCGKSSTFRAFKDTLVPNVISTDEWKEWWHTAKTLLVKDHFIELGTGTQPTLTLRDTPQDFSEEMKRRFDFAALPYHKAAYMLHYISEIQKDVPVDPSVLEHFSAGLAADMLQPGTIAFVAWLALAQAATYFQTTMPSYSPDWLADDTNRLECTCWFGWEPLFIEPFLDFLPGADPKWREHFSFMLPRAPLHMVERICVILSQEHDDALFAPLAESIIDPNLEAAEAFAWTWRTLAQEEPLPFTCPHDLYTMTTMFFSLINQANLPHEYSHQNLRGTLSTLRQTLSSNRYAVISSVFSRLASEYAAALYQAVTTNPGISTAMRSQLIQILAKI